MMTDAVGDFDKNIIDGAVNKLSDSVSAWGGFMAKLQSGNVRHYLMGVVAGFSVLVVCFLIFPSEIAQFASNVADLFMGLGDFITNWIITPLYKLIFWFGSMSMSVFGLLASLAGGVFTAFVWVGQTIASIF